MHQHLVLPAALGDAGGAGAALGQTEDCYQGVAGGGGQAVVGFLGTDQGLEVTVCQHGGDGGGDRAVAGGAGGGGGDAEVEGGGGALRPVVEHVSGDRTSTSRV